MAELRYRVKLVASYSNDAHYWYASSWDEANVIADTLLNEIPSGANPRVYIYIETSLGHVRIQ